MFILFQIQKFCGNDDTTRLLPLLIGDYKVIILTPQLLENNFIDNEIDGVEKFSMFVFDECHHAQKEDTYNKIMARYCKAKLLRKNVQLPQVGLLSSHFKRNYRILPIKHTVRQVPVNCL